MNTYLGVDMGTSSMKATLIDESGAIVWQSSRPTDVISPRDGFYEIDPVRDCRGNFLSLCAELAGKKLSQSVAAVCVSSMCASFLPVGEDYEPLYNVVLYGIDRRAAAITDELNQRYGADFLRERLGGTFSTQSIFPKVIWFQRELPKVYVRAHAFIPAYDAITSFLTGRCAWDAPTAFGSLLLELSTLDYPDCLLEDYCLERAKFPAVKSGLSVLGPLTDAGAEATGFRAGIPVMTGTGDINAEAMSAGAIDAGTALFALGSTTSMLLNCEDPVTLPGYMPGLSLKDGTWRIGAASGCGALFLKRVKEKFGEVPAPKKPTGIFFFPWFDGARSPHNVPDVRGTIYGLTSSHTAADVAASAYETIGYDVALLIDHAETLRPFPPEIHVTGGLCRDPEIAHLIADITGRTLLLHTSRDASCGSAMIALGALSGGAYPPVEPDAKIEPDPARRALYLPLRRRYVELCDKLVRV